MVHTLCYMLFLCFSILGALCTDEKSKSTVPTPSSTRIVSSSRGSFYFDFTKEESLYTVFVGTSLNDISVLDIIVTVPGGQSCPFKYVTAVESFMPSPVLPSEVTEPTFSQLIVSSITDISRSTVFCTWNPFMTTSVRNAKIHNRWFLMVQSTHADTSIINGTCRVMVSHRMYTSTEMYLNFAAVLIPHLIFLVVAAVFVVIARRRFTGIIALPMTFYSFLLFPPKLVVLFIYLQFKRLKHFISTKRLFPIAPLSNNDAMDTQSDDGSTEEICRICRECNQEQLIAPCQCTGSCRFVHRSCLDKWRIEAVRQNPQFITRCEICTAVFNIGIQKNTLASLMLFRFGVILAFVTCFVTMLFALSGLLYVTIGELSCFEPYHTVDYGSIVSFYSFLVSSIAYWLLCWVVYLGIIYVTTFFSSSIPLIGDSFWTKMRVLFVVGVAVFLSIMVLYSGYLLLLCTYALSTNAVWSWELNAFGGFICVFLLGFIVAVLFIVRSFCMRGNRGSQETAVVQNNVNETLPS